MLTCIPCLNTKDLMKDITKQLKSLSFKVVKRHPKKSRGSKEDGVVESNEGEEEEWIAEPEPGVLITLVSLTNGCNILKKIRFSEEIFDAFRAQRWWSENYDKIMELYSIQQETDPDPSSPIKSEDEFPIDSATVQDNVNNQSQMINQSADEKPKVDEAHNGISCSGEGSTALAEQEAKRRVTEWVVEDEPGVFVTIRMLPDGSREPLHVEFSRERFGEVKARVWWEENKARLRQQYS